MNENLWGEQFNNLIDTAKETFQAVRSLDSVTRENLIGIISDPRKTTISSTLFFEHLEKNLEIIERQSQDLFSQLFKVPLEKFLMGVKLSREEFYFLMAMNIGLPIITAEMLDLSSWNDFEFFSMFHYENEQIRCYINPGTKDEPGIKKTGLQFGRFPEELDLGGLRLDQQEFFMKNLPDLYIRFSVEKSNR